MGFCGLSNKYTGIIAGILTLLQSLVWCVLAIFLLLLFTCKMKVREDNLPVYLFYLVYLYKVETNDSIVQVPWPSKGAHAAAGMHAWTIIYLTFSILWALSALLLLIATVLEAKGRTGIKLRAPWMALTALFLIMDVAATIVYSLHISHTETLVELLEFVGVKEVNIPPVSSASSIFGIFTLGPSIAAALIFSRFLLLWALNLALFIHVTQGVRQHEKSEGAAPEARVPYQEYLKKLSTIGPIPDIKWDPDQRKRSDVPIVKPLSKPSPPNERKRKQSDYDQYMYYARQLPQPKLNIIHSEPSTPAASAMSMDRQMDDPLLEFQVQLPRMHIQSKMDRISGILNNEDLPQVPPPDYSMSNENVASSKRSSNGSTNSTDTTSEHRSHES